MKVQGDPFHLQTRFDNARFLFVEYIAPVAIPSQQIMDVHAACQQAFGEFERGNAATDHNRSPPAFGEFENIPRIT